MDAFVRWWFPVQLSGSRWLPCREMSPGHGPTGRGRITQLSLASELVSSGKAGEQDKEPDFTKAAPPSPHSICQGLLAWSITTLRELRIPRERVCWAMQCLLLLWTIWFLPYVALLWIHSFHERVLFFPWPPVLCRSLFAVHEVRFQTCKCLLPFNFWLPVIQTLFFLLLSC